MWDFIGVLYVAFIRNDLALALASLSKTSGFGLGLDYGVLEHIPATIFKKRTG